MKIYQVYEPTEMEAPAYFRTKREAVQAAREYADQVEQGEYIDVVLCLTAGMPVLDLVMCALHSEGWCKERRVVAQVPGRMRVGEDQ